MNILQMKKEYLTLRKKKDNIQVREEKNRATPSYYGIPPRSRESLMFRKILGFLKCQNDSNSPKPEVIVDFIFDNGLFFISINNISDKPAFKVSVEFDKKIFGIEGDKEISALPLFRNIEFLAPHKNIVTFLDTSASYFRREEPTKISARISYQDSNDEKHVTTINHDLEIYKEIGFIKRSENSNIQEKEKNCR